MLKGLFTLFRWFSVPNNNIKQIVTIRPTIATLVGIKENKHTVIKIIPIFKRLSFPPETR
jgi:hypothetical protein